MAGTVPELPSDNDLLRLISAGDEPAFVLLYRRHQGAVYRFALQMSGSTGIAEEVAQEVFMTVIREDSRYDPARGPVLAYLYGVARNYVRRGLQRDRDFAPLPDDADEAATGNVDPLAELTRHETIQSVRRAILSLPPNYREAVVLCDLHEMSYADAAAALGCAVGTLRSRLHRGRTLLLAKLRPRREARCLA